MVMSETTRKLLSRNPTRPNPLYTTQVCNDQNLWFMWASSDRNDAELRLLQTGFILISLS